MAFYSTVLPLATYEASSPLVPSNSMVQSLVSESFPILTENQFMTTAVWVGTPVGTISVKGSVDNVNFYIPLDSIATGGESGSRSFELAQTSVMYARIEYTFASGSGTLVCKVATKAKN